jgi:hypothetical protein
LPTVLMSILMALLPIVLRCKSGLPKANAATELY